MTNNSDCGLLRKCRDDFPYMVFLTMMMSMFVSLYFPFAYDKTHFQFYLPIVFFSLMIGSVFWIVNKQQKGESVE